MGSDGRRIITAVVQHHGSDRRSMSSLRTPRNGRPRGHLPAALHAFNRLASRIVVAAAVVMVVIFGGISALQACPAGKGALRLAAQSNALTIASQSLSNRAPDGVVGPALSVASTASTFASKLHAGDSLGHNLVHAGACSCCAACSAGLTTTGWPIVRGPDQRMILAFARNASLSIESEPQFRPPRRIV